MHFKRMLTGALLGVIGALVLALPASASNLKVTCVVNGEAKVADKTLPGGVQLVGGGGTYVFKNFGFTCAGTAKGAPYTETTTITSNGKFANVVCGTGAAYSAPGQTTATGAGKVAALAPTLEYKVQFIGTVGTIYINNANTAPKNAPKVVVPLLQANKPFPPPTQPLYEAGAVQLAPPTGKPPVVPPPVGSCTKAFTVTGSVLIDK